MTIREILEEKLQKGQIDPLTFLKANVQYTDILEKGLGDRMQKNIDKHSKKFAGYGKGEGSKGGHVIGHTRSGKPIYEHGAHSHYGNFHEDDHYEASHEHSKLADIARVKKNSHETLRSMAEQEKDRDGVRSHADKVKEYDEKEIHHSAQATYHQEQARPQAVRDRYSEVGKRVEKIRGN